MREVLARARRRRATARLALDVYLHRLRAAIAAMAAALGGLDALVFTGGVGERSAPVRELTADGLGFLGVGVDHALNRAATEDGDVSDRDARVRTLVVSAARGSRDRQAVARRAAARVAIRRGAWACAT